MKKTGLLFVGLILLTLIYKIGTANGKTQALSPNQATADYVIISYIPLPGANRTVTIYHGGDQVEEIRLTKEGQNKSASNYVIDLLTKFNSAGYQLVSTSSAGPDEHINCFLKKVK